MRSSQGREDLGVFRLGPVPMSKVEEAYMGGRMVSMRDVIAMRVPGLSS